MLFTNAEYADMVFVYGFTNGNALEARRVYAERYPNRQLPNARTFGNVFQRLRDTGSFKTQAHNRGRNRSVCTPEVENNILAAVEENPGASVRRIALDVGVSGPLVWRTLHEQLLHPFHIQRVQAINVPDLEKRMQFCQWFLLQSAEDEYFAAKILFTDEAGFNKDGIFNFHNNHVWSDENPHAVVESRHQHRFSLNIWLGLLGDQLLGPVVLPQRLTGPAYLNFLINTLPVLLEDIPLNLRINLWFMQDGAPPHFTLVVRNYLNQEFNNRWIGRGGPISWPPRSPDLTPLDFCIWGYLKSLVYANPVRDVDELQQRIENACQTIRTKPGFFQRVRNSFRRRCRACVEVEGGHFEHLL